MADDRTPEEVVAEVADQVADAGRQFIRSGGDVLEVSADELAAHVEATPGLFKNAFVFRLSREEAVAQGLVEPTYEERMATYEWALQHRADKAEARALFERAKEAIAALDPAEWPIATKVLALHAPKAPYPGDRELPPVCGGCPPDNEWGEREWPCATVQAVCEFPGIGIVLPDHDLLEEDYEPVHPDNQPPWEPFRLRDLFPQSFVKMDPIVFGASKGGSGE